MSPTAKEALRILKELSPEERLRVVSAVTEEMLTGAPADVDKEGPPVGGAAARDGSQREGKRVSLYGLWKDLGIDLSAEDIDAARREMWGNFPRDDF